jgi:cytoskeletal protein CcmA (bactofilin family)
MPCSINPDRIDLDHINGARSGYHGSRVSFSAEERTVNIRSRISKTGIAAIAVALVLGALPWSAIGQDTGDLVVKRGSYGDDLYAAGRSVDIDATVNGDVVAAGGDVSLAGTVRGDILAAGGNLDIKGKVDDDARVAAGTLVIDLKVGDDLLAAGGQIRTSAATRVGGHAWFAGGTLNLSGEFAHDVHAAGGQITLAGEVHGNASLTGDKIILLPGTVIDGNLTYRSENALNMDKDVIVRGTVTRKPYPAAHREHISLGAAPFIVFYISIYLLALFLALVFPRFSSGAAERLRFQFLASLGLGFAVLVVTPVAAILAFILVVTFLPGLVLLALYPVALLTGVLVSVVRLGETGARLLRRDAAATPGARALSLLAALVVLALIDLVPVLGGLVWFLLIVVGMGAGGLQLARQYSGRT